MIVTSVDTRGLDFVLNGVRNALIGTGGDISELTKDESRLLALQLMRLSQPRDRKKLADKIENSVRSRFELFGQDQHMDSKWSGGQSSSGVEWYNVSKNFLYGFDQGARDMRKATAQQMKDVYYSSATHMGRARLISEFKYPRQHQRVAIVKTILTSAQSLKRGVAAVQKSIGKLAASWAATAKTIDISAKIPAWIARHLTRGSQSSRSITDLSGLSNLEHPSVTFGSKARGAGTNEGKRNVQYAVNRRIQNLTYRLKLILSGYSKDVAQGIRVKRHHRKGTE